MKTAIIIVTYNAAKWIDICLGSCMRYAPHCPVYVIDNNSSDDSVKIIKEKYPQVNLSVQSKNTGFAGGNNIGMKMAIANGAEVVFLLNPDAEIHANTIDECTKALQANPKLAVVQPLILLPNGLVNTIGNSFHYLGLAEAGGNGMALSEAEKKVYHLVNRIEPGYISGAAMMIRTSVLKEVGMFDEYLFIYHEDAELSWRCRLAGWQLGVVETAIATHHYDFSRSITRFYYVERNRLLVWSSYLKIRTWLLLLIPFIVSEMMLMAWAIMTNFYKERLAVYNFMLKREAIDYILQKRKELKNIRRISDRHFLSFAGSTIQSQGVSSMVTSWLFNPLSTFVWKIIYPLIRW